MTNTASTASRAKALIDLIAMGEKTAAAAYFLVVPSGPKAVVAASCAQMFDMSFDCVDPFTDVPARRDPAVLVAVSAKEPSRDEIQQMVHRITASAPLSVVIVQARGRSVEDFAGEIRDAHPEVLVVTSHSV